MMARSGDSGRRGIVQLLDKTAILAGAAYVDLNPIRAAIAETIEGSDFTSAKSEFVICRLGSLRSRKTRLPQRLTQPRMLLIRRRRKRHAGGSVVLGTCRPLI